MNLSGTSEIELAPLALDAAPGLNAYSRDWLRGAAVLRQAGVRVSSGVEARTGPAWAAESFARWIRQEHESMEAPQSSLDHLEALRNGAPCVITGQQPALLGGPLYCAWKIAGAVGLARELSRRWERPVVPVYWCGADDSDFEEARNAWIEDASGPSARLQLPARAHEPGTMVGEISSEEILPLERSAFSFLSGIPTAEKPPWAHRTPEGLDLGRWVQSMMLQLFSFAGLVAVDARSAPLRELGRELFEEYARKHEDVETAVARRGEELKAAGYDIPLSEAAVRSGLFRLEERRRVKLQPGELLEACRRDEELAPSVLLRPLWQDALLAPVAAVLGPSELLYHAQLKPAYRILQVRAASPSARPHLTCLPSRLPWPTEVAAQRDLLTGGEAGRRALAALSLPRRWRDSLKKLREGTGDILSRFEDEIGDATAAKGVGRAMGQIRSGIDRLDDALAKEALKGLADGGGGWERAVEFLAPRGVPQERIFSVVNGWKWWGESFPALVDALAERFAADVMEGIPPLYFTRRPEEEEKR